MTPEYLNKYQRQTMLSEIGIAGQQKLWKAKVLVIGAGGLGCPALQMLANSGVGNIGIVDFDCVEITNLHRQILYTEADIGQQKVKVAGKKLHAINPNLHLQLFDVELNRKNAVEIISPFDMVIDGTDNFFSRYTINDICYLLKKPLVYGSVYKFEGQVAVFNVKDSNGIEVNYRHLFPDPPGANEVPTCNQTGVSGILTGIIGNLQASEAVKIITGIGNPLANKVYTFNLLQVTGTTLAITDQPYIPEKLPLTIEDFKADSTLQTCDSTSGEIDHERFSALLNDPTYTIIDVREKGEMPVSIFPRQYQIPLSEITQNHELVSSYDKIIFVCSSGVRSKKVVSLLKEIKFGHIHYSLTGGINKWLMRNQNKYDG